MRQIWANCYNLYTYGRRINKEAPFSLQVEFTSLESACKSLGKRVISKIFTWSCMSCMYIHGHVGHEMYLNAYGHVWAINVVIYVNGHVGHAHTSCGSYTSMCINVLYMNIHICTCTYLYMNIPGHERTYTSTYMCMKWNVHERTRMWTYLYMNIFVHDGTSTWKYLYRNILEHECTCTWTCCSWTYSSWM